MKALVLTLILTAVLVLPAQARLGETEDLLINRYGGEISNQWSNIGNGLWVKELIFKRTGFQIDVYLFNGFSAQENFTKLTQPAFSREEKQTLLQANTQGHKWAIVPNSGPEWHRDDGAMAVDQGGYLVLTSKELIDAQTTAFKAANASSLEGF